MKRLLILNSRGETLYKMSEIGFTYSAPTQAIKLESEVTSVDAVGSVIDGPIAEVWETG